MNKYTKRYKNFDEFCKEFHTVEDVLKWYKTTDVYFFGSSCNLSIVCDRVKSQSECCLKNSKICSFKFIFVPSRIKLYHVFYEKQ